MATTPQQAISTIARLGEELRLRQPDVTLFDEYYRGKHKLRFASDQFREYFARRYTGFSDNWTQVVGDAPTERLELVGIRPKDMAKGGDDELWGDWSENDADALSDLAFLDAIIAKRAYALVWARDDETPTISWEHPSQAIVGYDPETRERTAGLKLWRDDQFEYATLYAPAWVWKFQRSAVRVAPDQRTESGLYVVGSVGGWQPRQPASDDTWPLPNPLGVVPLVEFPNRPRLLGAPMSDIAGTVAMQDAINLLWSYLFNAADYASFPQRVILGAERPRVPVLDANGQVIGDRPVELEKFAVNRVNWIEDPNAKIGEWSAANLEAYTKVIEVQVGHIAAQTRTPQHYLIGKMANLSADALKAAETGLVKRTEEKTEHFGRAAREVFRLLALVRGDQRKAAAVARGTVLWKDVESRSEAQLVDALLKMKQVGFPFKFLAERYGLSPPEIERIMEMIREENELDPIGALGRQIDDGRGVGDQGNVEPPAAG